MQVLLLDRNPAVCDAWQAAFHGEAGVRVILGDFQSFLGEYDCFVSPANGFGLMRGGIDASLCSLFGSHLEARVQEAIWHSYRGEQPVGTALLVPTGDTRCPWLAHCPTMRMPEDVSHTHHAYAAFLAALTTAALAGIRVLACPGLGTLTGRLPPGIAARQMRYAFDLWRGSRILPAWSNVEQRVTRSFGRN